MFLSASIVSSQKRNNKNGNEKLGKMVPEKRESSGREDKWKAWGGRAVEALEVRLKFRWNGLGEKDERFDGLLWKMFLGDKCRSFCLIPVTGASLSDNISVCPYPSLLPTNSKYQAQQKISNKSLIFIFVILVLNFGRDGTVLVFIVLSLFSKFFNVIFKIPIFSKKNWLKMIFTYKTIKG